MLVSYNWLKEYVGDALPAPEEVADLLTFHAFEIESVEPHGDDTVIDVKILPDRGSDCLSQRGVARELASILGVSLEKDPLVAVPALRTTEAISITIEDATMCPRFTAGIISGITVGPSPAWLVKRLEALGQRSINNIVDATNYVMYATGQPLHAYDADKFPAVDGVWKFGVRAAKEGEEVSLLAEGGKQEDRIVTLKGGELLVVDASTDTPIGLAGVKGGRFAGVDEQTTRIIVEAAHFHPGRTRKTARGLGIVIDASKRFENEPSRNLPPYAQAEIIALITDIAGGTFEGWVDAYPAPVTNPAVTVVPTNVNARLGLTLSIDEIAALLHRVGATVTKNENQTLTCVGPFERTDLTIEENFIEEVGRIYGYQHVESVVPITVPLQEYNQRHVYTERIRTALVALGYSEVITSSFRKKDQIRLLSSLASDKEYLRSMLTKNITEVLDKNAPFTDLLGTSDTRVFEIGNVFEKTTDNITEHTALALGVRVKQSGYSGKEDGFIKEAQAAVEAALGVTLAWKVEKGVAEVNLTPVFATLSIPTTYDEVVPSPAVTVRPFSVYPAMSRDIAMWVSEGTDTAEVMSTLRAPASELCVRITHVDSFTKEGRTSLAFRLVFQAMDRTLTDEEVNPLMEAVYAAATAAGWETR